MVVVVGGRLGKRARICRECFTPLFAIDDAERTGTIDAGFPGTDDHGELKLRKRASPARFLRCAWSAANETIRSGSIFERLHWADDAFDSGNAAMMCLQRIRHALVLRGKMQQPPFISALYIRLQSN